MVGSSVFSEHSFRPCGWEVCGAGEAAFKASGGLVMLDDLVVYSELL